MKTLAALFLLMCAIPSVTFAAEGTDWRFTPHVAFGYNPAQGSYTSLGVDYATMIDENWRTGVSAFYSQGQHPADDREIGAGPFVSYSKPLLKVLFASVREDIDYLDLKNPIKMSNGTYTHTSETGVASATSASLSMFFTPYFGISGGYRLVVAISNSALDDDRSGFFFGIALGF